MKISNLYHYIKIHVVQVSQIVSGRAHRHDLFVPLQSSGCGQYTVLTFIYILVLSLMLGPQGGDRSNFDPL